MLQRHRAIASLFFFAGLVACIGIFVLCRLSNILGGMGDGAGGASGPISTPGVIVPYGLYFVCGVEAAMSLKRAYRKAIGVFGHVVPFFSLVFAGHGNAAFFIGSTLITFLLFAFFWFLILAEGRNEN